MTIPIEELAVRLKDGQKLLGLDLGSKTIGLALSDGLLLTATPLETLKRRRFRQDAERLLSLAATENVGGFIIGYPVNMNGSVGPRAQATRAFARNLEEISDMPIVLWDERLSTAGVERTLLEADVSRKRRTEVVDKMAAAWILQGALDRLRSLRS